ncbi:DMT family transporter [Cnuibacter physcomitrellae]|uniref:DMT family transporter n=1 Tax=Cnuibacter physcomitrellae TaxID=1619308 RepID=UPI002175BE17|nr:DMT family transporter [Cnuibacter physcomitrellae]MCS5495933.1 DMT family transporter [Cnuibacter physcomitrellae]
MSVAERQQGGGTDAAGAARPLMPLWLAVVVAFVCGALMATQSRVNGELGTRLGDGFSASVLSFGSGLVIVTVILLLMPSGRRGLRRIAPAVREGRLPVWPLFGGLSGAFFVLTQSIASVAVGISVFTIAFVGGLTASGLLVDRLGLGPGGRRPITTRRALGAALAVAAVVWSVSAHIRVDIPVWLLLLPLIAGFVNAIQQGGNGRLGAAVGSGVTSTFVNFVMGTAGLVIALVIHAAVAGTGLPTAYPGDWWLYTGGVLGVAFIFGLATAVRVTGVLILGLCTVAGQLTGALVLDLALPGVAPLDWTTPAAILVVVLGVAIATIPARRRTPR